MYLRDFFYQNSEKLKQAGIVDHKLETRILISNYMNWTQSKYISSLNSSLKSKHIYDINTLIKRRINHEPLQYITGIVEFYKRTFLVNKDVLIPRNETEILIEEAIKFIKKNKINNPKILDLCTGSGIIAISIAKEIPDASITATDISQKALDIAKIHAKKHNIKINLIKSDCLENINEEYNIVISNPPYIKTNNLKFLEKEVRMEPKIALDGGHDGVKIIKKIIEHLPKICIFNKYAVFIEIDPEIKKKCVEISQNTFPDSLVYTVKDLKKLDRILIIKNN